MSDQHAMQYTEIKRLRLFGLVGVVAAGMMFASDCIMLDSSSSGAEFGRIALSRLTDSPNWRLTLGGVGGPIAACIFVVGIAHIFIALRPGGPRLAGLCAVGLATGYVILGAWHAALPMFAFVNRLQPGAENPMDHESWNYLVTLGFVGFVPAAFSLILFPFLIMIRKTLYPKWFAVLTPGILYACALFSFAPFPAPIGGFLVMGSGSLSFLFYFVFSTAILWNPAIPPGNPEATAPMR